MSDNDIMIVDKVNYVTDIKSKLELEKYLFMNVVPQIGIFGEILTKLGFDTSKPLYLKRKKDKAIRGIIFYYSYDKDKFSEDNMIEIGCVFSRSIELVCNGQSREYNIRINNNNDIYLENEYFENKKKVNGISYYYCVYNGELEIFISNDFGEKIEFSCDVIINESEIVSKLENNGELEKYIFNINFNDSIFDILNNLCEYIDIFKFKEIKNVSINYLKYGDVISSCLIENSNIRVNVKDEGTNEISYELDRNKSNCDVKYLIILSDKNDYELKIELVNDDIDFKLKNEIELRKYLLGLRYPLRIEEVLNKLSEISFGDIGQYEYLFLAFRYNSYQWTDMIELSKGNLDSFKITRNGKIYQIYKDGEFHYEVENESSNYSVDMMGDVVIRCQQYCENGLDTSDDSNRFVYKSIREAKEGKVRTRKLIDEMLKKEGRE